jgi:hypothetical protein
MEPEGFKIDLFYDPTIQFYDPTIQLFLQKGPEPSLM